MSRIKQAHVVQNEPEVVDWEEFQPAHEPSSKDEIEASMDRERFDKSIARSMELFIRVITDASLGFWPAEIHKIKFDVDGLLVSTRLPFPILRPSHVSGEWPPSLAEQKHLREKFAQYLRRQENEKELSSFYYLKLVNFLIEDQLPAKLSPGIIKSLKRIPQRDLAGRPADRIDSDMRRRIISDGPPIRETIEKIRIQITGWLKKKQMLDQTICRRIRAQYPASKFPWIEYFLDLGLNTKLPRRRYWKNSENESQYSEDASPDAKQSPCGISEPNEWSIIDITAKVLQKHLKKETGRLVPLRKLRTRLG